MVPGARWRRPHDESPRTFAGPTTQQGVKAPAAATSSGAAAHIDFAAAQSLSHSRQATLSGLATVGDDGLQSMQERDRTLRMRRRLKDGAFVVGENLE